MPGRPTPLLVAELLNENTSSLFIVTYACVILDLLWCN